MKTKKQQKREKKHLGLIALFWELDAAQGSRMAVWGEMERRTGYSREYITRVLRKNGVQYQKKRGNDTEIKNQDNASAQLQGHQGS